MKMTSKMQLGLKIAEKINEEFDKKHLSGNLQESIKVVSEGDKVLVIIDAPVYNMYQFFRHGVVIPNGNASYASFLDEVGSEFMIYPKHGKRFLATPHNHKGFVMKSIVEGAQEWASTKGYTIRYIQGQKKG